MPDARTETAAALFEVNKQRDAKPPPTGVNKTALDAAHEELTLALTAISLRNLDDAANAVANAAADLQAITNGTAGPALAHIASARDTLPRV